MNFDSSSSLAVFIRRLSMTIGMERDWIVTRSGSIWSRIVQWMGKISRRLHMSSLSLDFHQYEKLFVQLMLTNVRHHPMEFVERSRRAVYLIYIHELLFVSLFSFSLALAKLRLFVSILSCQNVDRNNHFQSVIVPIFLDAIWTRIRKAFLAERILFFFQPNQYELKLPNEFRWFYSLLFVWSIYVINLNTPRKFNRWWKTVSLLSSKTKN